MTVTEQELTTERPSPSPPSIEEQDWTSPLSHAYNNNISTTKEEDPVIIILDNKVVSPNTTTNKSISRSVIPRSNSLDNNYLFRGKHEYKTFYSTNPSLFPLSGYSEYDLEEEEETSHLAVAVVRSYSVDSSNKREFMPGNICWKLVASNSNGSDIYPDMTHTSRKAPIFGHEIRIIPPANNNQYGTIHAFTVRGSTIIIGTSHYTIKSFNIKEISSNILFSPTVSGSSSTDNAVEESNSSNNGTATTNITTANMTNNNTENDIIKSICFSPAIHPNDDNKIIWAGTENGSILAIDITTEQILVKRMATHSHPITFILRHRNTELWTLDNGGNLNIWPMLKKNDNTTTTTSTSTSTSTINLLDTSPERYQVTPNCRTAILSIKKSTLWCSSGRSIDKLDRTENESIPLIQIPNEFGEIIRLIIIPFHQQNQIYALHSDGKMTAWDIHTLEKIKCIVISVSKLTSVTSVGDYHLWVGYDNGTIAIYDTRSEPWIVIKIWKAHINPVTKIEVDDFSIIESMSVVSMDSAGHLAIWDGLLAEDWLEQQMLTNVPEYSDLNELNVMICSWNMDAVKPDALTDWDKEKLHEWLYGMSDPDIIMIGIQEIVDLGSKTITAKSFLSLSKKIDSIKEADELLTHRYMLWYDYFTIIIAENFGPGTYKILKTDQLVGLFSCVFIKTSHQDRVHQCDSTNVKTGFRVMTKGLHGNKGGIATRFIFDDTSLCFVNCHLASGQTHILQRNADMEGILNSARFSSAVIEQPAVFSRETDGSSILDHETCFLSGDLNYRISMQREQVLGLLSETSSNKFEVWEALQHEDQFKKQQAMNPLFRLYNFKEAPILFDPTYKYDRGTDLYDTSEKKRVPAWCDRILYRAPSTLTNVYYRRHEVRASDHRPISAGFTVPVKTIIQEKREQVKEKIKAEWQANMVRLSQGNKVRYVTNYDLCDENEAQGRLEKADWDLKKVVMDLYHDKGCYI